jgi:hypothetical protein
LVASVYTAFEIVAAHTARRKNFKIKRQKSSAKTELFFMFEFKKKKFFLPIIIEVNLIFINANY